MEREAVVEPESYDDLKRAWTKLHAEMIAWAKENIAGRKDVVLHGWGVWPSWMVVMHVANHATHHFGQLVTLLNQLGLAPEPTDFTDLMIYYIGRYPQANQTELAKSFLA